MGSCDGAASGQDGVKLSIPVRPESAVTEAPPPEQLANRTATPVKASFAGMPLAIYLVVLINYVFIFVISALFSNGFLLKMMTKPDRAQS
jgi:hypothetical protein